MRTIEINVYKFTELSAAAKQRAKDSAAALGYNWSAESLQSLRTLAEHFSGKLVDYSVNFFASSPSSAAFEMPDDMDRAEIQRRLEMLGGYNAETLRGNGDCKLTGYCSDEDAIDGFRRAFLTNAENNLGILMQAAFETWLKSAQDDCAAQFSDSVFSDNSDANNYEYYENGELV